MLNNKPSVCIVGSGPGGAISAIELARSGLFRVILVDLDKITDASEDSDNILKSLSTINTGYPFGQEVTRGFGFGGGSRLWHGVLTKLDDQDWSLLDSRVNKTLSNFNLSTIQEKQKKRDFIKKIMKYSFLMGFTSIAGFYYMSKKS